MIRNASRIIKIKRLKQSVYIFRMQIHSIIITSLSKFILIQLIISIWIHHAHSSTQSNQTQLSTFLKLSSKPFNQNLLVFGKLFGSGHHNTWRILSWRLLSLKSFFVVIGYYVLLATSFVHAGACTEATGCCVLLRIMFLCSIEGKFWRADSWSVNSGGFVKRF